jgi:hypothetical protein
MIAPSVSAAQFALGDRLVVVNQDTEVCRHQQVVEKLQKGTIVTVKAIQDRDGELWVKIDRAGKGDYGWIYGENLARDGLVRVKLDKLRISVVRKEDSPIHLPAGTSRLVEESETVRHSIEISKRWKIEAGARIQVQSGGVVAYGPAIVREFAKAEAELRAEIEVATGQYFGLESKRTRSVTINGGTAKPIKVVWLDYYRTGITTMLVAGEVHEIPFEYREDFGLVAIEADEVSTKPSPTRSIGRWYEEEGEAERTRTSESGWRWEIIYGAIGFYLGVAASVAVAFVLAIRSNRLKGSDPGVD